MDHHNLIKNMMKQLSQHGSGLIGDASQWRQATRSLQLQLTQNAYCIGTIVDFPVLWIGTSAKRIEIYRARQKKGSQVARIFQARPGISGKQQQEQNSRNLGTVLLPGPVHIRENCRKRI